MPEFHQREMQRIWCNRVEPTNREYCVSGVDRDLFSEQTFVRIPFSHKKQIFVTSLVCVTLVRSIAFKRKLCRNWNVVNGYGPLNAGLVTKDVAKDIQMSQEFHDWIPWQNISQKFRRFDIRGANISNSSRWSKFLTRASQLFMPWMLRSIHYLKSRDNTHQSAIHKSALRSFIARTPWSSQKLVSPTQAKTKSTRER